MRSAPTHSQLSSWSPRQQQPRRRRGPCAAAGRAAAGPLPPAPSRWGRGKKKGLVMNRRPVAPRAGTKPALPLALGPPRRAAGLWPAGSLSVGGKLLEHMQRVVHGHRLLLHGGVVPQ